jgi:hypothetical protein
VWAVERRDFFEGLREHLQIWSDQMDVELWLVLSFNSAVTMRVCWVLGPAEPARENVCS